MGLGMKAWLLVFWGVKFGLTDLSDVFKKQGMKTKFGKYLTTELYCWWWLTS